MKRPIVIILLAIAFLLAGAGIVATLWISAAYGSSTLSVSSFGGDNLQAKVEESKSLEVDGAVTLTAQTNAGSVTVTGGDVKTVEVKVVKIGYALTQDQAEKYAQAAKYEIKQDGNVIALIYNSDSNGGPIHAAVDFIITTPRETSASIKANLGGTSVTNLKGAVDIEDDFGDVTVENIEGVLAVNGNSGDLKITDVRAGGGNILLNSDFGEISLTQASAKNVTINFNSGNATLSDIKAGAELKVEGEFGDVELKRAYAGSYDLRSNSGSIVMDGAKNKLKASSEFGDITITNASSVTLDLESNSGGIKFSGSLGDGPHVVNSDFGDVTLSLPADSKLNVDLQTDFGNIDSNIPLTVTPTGKSDSSRDHQVGTMNGGGAQLTVTANSGDINIQILSK
jgi:DUF4097 and DUF4098 domain-containing protein YvlB